VSEGYKQKEATATRFHLLACLADHTGEHTRRGRGESIESVVRQPPETICGSYDCSSPGLGLCSLNRCCGCCAGQGELTVTG
jgi:hypothetical protein